MMKSKIIISLNREAGKEIELLKGVFNPDSLVEVEFSKEGPTIAGGMIDPISIIDISIPLLPISIWASMWYEYLPKKIDAILQSYSGIIQIKRLDQGYQCIISNEECFIVREDGKKFSFESYSQLFDFMSKLDQQNRNDVGFLCQMNCIVQVKVSNGTLKRILLEIISFFSTIVGWIESTNLWVWKRASEVMLYFVLLVLWYALNCTVLPMGGAEYIYFGITECPTQNVGELLWKGIFTFLITFAGIYGAFYANGKRQIKNILYYAVLLCVVFFLYMLVGLFLKLIDEVGYLLDLLEPFFVLIIRYLMFQALWILLFVIGRGLTKIVDFVWKGYYRNIKKNIIKKDL